MDEPHCHEHKVVKKFVGDGFFVFVGRKFCWMTSSTHSIRVIFPSRTGFVDVHLPLWVKHEGQPDGAGVVNFMPGQARIGRGEGFQAIPHRQSDEGTVGAHQ